MPVLQCLTCGAPAASAATPCPHCGIVDAGPAAAPPPTDADERLLERVVATLRAKSELSPGDDAEAVRARLHGQALLLGARLHSRAAAPDEREQAFLEYALARVERALSDLEAGGAT